jgi:hypothetical protein
MSTDFGAVFKTLSGYEDPKEIELVENVIAKTKAGKIIWQRQSSSLFATVGALQMNFVHSSTSNALAARLLGVGGSWDIFSIRRQNGTEILKVAQPQTGMLAGLGAPPTPPGSQVPPPSRSKLLQAVDTLYEIASSRGQGDIDNAIDVIKNL